MAAEGVLDPWVEKWMAENPMIANSLSEFDPMSATARQIMTAHATGQGRSRRIARRQCVCSMLSLPLARFR